MAYLPFPAQPPPTDEELDSQVKIAEKECLEARATYSLKQSVVEDVLIVDPVLKAVHSGLKATPTERYAIYLTGSLHDETPKLTCARALRPLIDRRDTLEIAHTNLSSSFQMLLKETARVSADNIRAMERNRSLTATLLPLAQKVQARKDEVSQDARFGAQLEELRQDAARARQRWRMMKSVAAALVAGSGIDWAGDDNLRDLVVDEENEAD